MGGEDRAAVPQLTGLTQCGALSPCSRDVKGQFEEPVRDRAACASSLCPPLAGFGILAHTSQ